MIPEFKPYEKTYMSQFLSLRCAGDVLNVLNPITRAEKEITEAMALINRLRKPALKYPMHYTLVDLCAGNALTSAIGIHLLPFKEAIAVDIRPRHRKWGEIKRFTYCEADINSLSWRPESHYIITSSHPCTRLASEIVDIHVNDPLCDGLALMPCCVGRLDNRIIGTGLNIFIEKIGKYETWALQLALQANGKVDIDHKCLSPRNAIVTAWKRNM